MWLLTLLPSGMIAFIVNVILIVGILGFAASWFFGFVVRYLPQLAPHRMLIQIASIAILVLGVYFKGGQVVEQQWRDKVAELEQKVAIAEEKSKAVNDNVQVKVVEKIKVVKDTQVVIKEKLRDVNVTIDAQCKIHPQVVDILNEAAGVKKK